VADKQRTDSDRAKASRAKAWGLRCLVLGGIALLCLSTGSARPAFALAMTWVPNYPFLGAAMIGVLRLPHFLERVYPTEAALYRWVGVGLIKAIVTSRAWQTLVALELPPKPSSRHVNAGRKLHIPGGRKLHT